MAYKLKNPDDSKSTVVLFVDGKQVELKPGKSMDLPSNTTQAAAQRMAMSNKLVVLEGKDEVEGNIAPSVPSYITDKPHSLRSPSESTRVADVTHEATPGQAEVKLPVDFVQKPGGEAIKSKSEVEKEHENAEDREGLMKNNTKDALVDKVVELKKGKVGKGDVEDFSKAQLVDVLTGEKSVEDIKKERAT